MRFLYILAGQKGSVYNSCILSNAQTTGGFTTIQERYQLGNVGYENSEFVLLLYQGVRCHLKKVQQVGLKSENAKELFNLRHLSLQNVVECIFRVVKKQQQILSGKGCEYSIET